MFRKKQKAKTETHTSCSVISIAFFFVSFLFFTIIYPLYILFILLWSEVDSVRLRKLLEFARKSGSYSNGNSDGILRYWQLTSSVCLTTMKEKYSLQYLYTNVLQFEANVIGFLLAKRLKFGTFILFIYLVQVYGNF